MNSSVADTILSQLGGQRFIVMTGAKYLVNADHALMFRIGRNSSRANSVRIILGANDLYTIRFLRNRKVGFAMESSLVQEVEGLYADQLRSAFERVTGLATTLGTMGGQLQAALA